MIVGSSPVAVTYPYSVNVDLKLHSTSEKKLHSFVQTVDVYDWTEMELEINKKHTITGPLNPLIKN